MTILLRTLTLKSSLQEGKYAGVPIQSLIDLGHTNYLQWVYYNYSIINFTDDILDMIFMPKSFRIDKPGKNPELHEKVTKIVQSSLRFNHKKRSHMNKRIFYANRQDKCNKLREIAITNRKDILQKVNHGHKLI